MLEPDVTISVIRLSDGFHGRHSQARAADGGPITVFLAHLRRDSVRVSVGQRVRTGDVIGEVGNSGNSLTPHVHVEVMDGPDPLQARSLPFRFHRYERWRGEAWEPMREAIPTAGERIRRML